MWSPGTFLSENIHSARDRILLPCHFQPRVCEIGRKMYETNERICLLSSFSAGEVFPLNVLFCTVNCKTRSIRIQQKMPLCFAFIYVPENQFGKWSGFAFAKLHRED